MRSHAETLANRLSATAALLFSKSCRNLNNLRTSFFCFALKNLDELGPARIADGFGEVVVLDHALYSQVLNDDGAVPVHIPAGDLVQKILTLANNLKVPLRNRPRSFLATVGQTDS
jgi:hypothetical protein